MDLTKKVLQKITKQRLVSGGDLILIGVSGGADSVALLSVLHQLQHRLAIRLHIAHFNHRLRASSNKDERFVKALALKFNLPVTIDRRKGTLKTKILSEDQARRLRFQFFSKTARKIKAQSIALAHTENDLAETVLMRLLRGSGLLGLRGILSENEMGQERFIRPLLSIKRSEIEAYLKAQHQSFCTDETNSQTQYLRNKIRLKLLPKLIKDYNANTPDVLVDLAYSAQGDYDFLLSQARGLFKKHARVSQKKIVIKLKYLAKEHVSMRRMLLRLSFEHLVSNLNQLNFAHIEEAEDMLLSRPVGSVVHWPQSVKLLKSKDECVITFKS